MTISAQQDVVGALEGYYLISILEGLHRLGALMKLRIGCDVEEVARECGIDSFLLRSVVDFVRKRCSDVLPSGGPPSALSEPGLLDATFLRHLLDQYVGAFGPCLADIEQVLADPAVGARRVDWVRHARAFSHGDRGIGNELPVRLLIQLGIHYVVDIGCGGGGLLLDFAELCPSARVWGVDSNPTAVSMARRAATAAGVAERVKFLEGDAFDFSEQLNADAQECAEVIAAFNVANAFFGGTEARGIRAWLQSLRRSFPNRFLLLGDYYGCLNHNLKGHSHHFRRALIHDVAQVLTGQGVPPENVDAWREILASVGCTLVKAFEGQDDEVAHFVYLIQL
jgi:SAM-dependent methyltransferase